MSQEQETAAGTPKQPQGSVWHRDAPYVQVLSNGRLRTFVTEAGSGGSFFEDQALTRWTPDRTRDADGFFVYIQDLESGTYWSAGHQPVRREPEQYEVNLRAGQFVVQRQDEGVATTMEACVAPHDNIELRRLTLTNTTDRPRHLAVTSYAEVVINDPQADTAHPAFSKLFVQTEYAAEQQALLARRRPRSPDEQTIWLIHAMAGAGEAPTYETDRARFIGRGRSPAAPHALDPEVELTGTTGNVLDPIVSFRRAVTLAPEETVQVTLGLGGAHARDEALDLIGRYRTADAVAEAFEAAIVQATAVQEELGIDGRTARFFRRLTSALFYDDPALRAPEDLLQRAAGQPADLQAHGLSGRRPLVIGRIADEEELGLARVLLDAYRYGHRLGLVFDLLLLNDESDRHTDALQKRLQTFVRETVEPPARERIAVLVADTVPAEDQWLMQSVARVVVRGEVPEPHAEQPDGADPFVRQLPLAADEQEITSGVFWTEEGLQFENGYGGFSEEGRTYVIRLEPDEKGRLRRPPLPWVNVVANEACGFMATESGAGYTWSVNSRENRLTPWYNDPIMDPHGEALYVRDEETGRFWSPQPGPAPQAAPYEVRHGFGYTRWHHRSEGLEQAVCQFVPRYDPVKITRLEVTNRSDRTRRLSLFVYHRLVMGEPLTSSRYVVTSFDEATEVLQAVNRNNGEYAQQVTFAAAAAPVTDGSIGHTGDRTAFLGRHGSLAQPAVLRQMEDLDGHTGAALDPCAALQVPVELAPGETITCSFLLGQAASEEEVKALVERYREEGFIAQALEEVRAFWNELVATVQIETPVPEIDLMVNGWLLYQTLSCRLWGRSAYYQSGGAFGFRDQLQDVSALVYAWPERTREQILLHAAHQFVEGDVLHWWHPPASKGMRTRFSDDLLWLPYITAFYVQATGDVSVLNEEARFLTARALAEGEDEAFLVPDDAGRSADVYEHCCRALDRSLTKGPHGLPLMGTGDWNDGMNRVGRAGRGESVWLGFFLYDILARFIPLCRLRSDHERVERYAAYQAHLAETLNDTGWDGGWYRRAYYDNGAPLGSSESDECQIDALAQAWAVLSGVAPAERAAMALDAMEERLVSEEEGIIRLLTPAFDQTPHDPGYIKGYIPGVRENGGQYTHAALWAVRALAEAGRGDRAGALLRMLSPVAHARTPEEVATYKVEPYVVAADVYGVAPHVGRGGWTWYTGSAGWMYRVALESLLGLRLDDNTLIVDPCIPAGWPGFIVRHRRPDGETTYVITVRNPNGRMQGVASAQMDGEVLPREGGAVRIPFADDGEIHQVEITLGA